MSGPYESAAAAHVDAVQVYETARGSSERGIAARINNERLLAALTEARVTAGAYDQRILGWLAGWEPEVGQVVIGWVERAHIAGRQTISEMVTALRALTIRAEAYIEPCDPPAIWLGDGFDRCGDRNGTHGTWPCGRTVLAWELRGLDAAAEQRRAMDSLLAVHAAAERAKEAKP